MKLLIDEIFYSIQGEGPRTGVPSVFIRFATCNLRCSWCDTADPDHKDKYIAVKSIEMDHIDIINAILDLGKKHNLLNRNFDVVFTGGEPMIYQEYIIYTCAILHGLLNLVPRFTIETNGTIKPSEELNQLIDQYSVSIKLANSNNKEKLRIRPKAIKYFVDNHNACFKFVITSEEDLKEVKKLQKKYNILSDDIYLMPEGTTDISIMNGLIGLVHICLEEGYNLSNRLQVLIWGNQRGT